MTFPTIPTAGASRVLFTNAVGASGTRTFPNLSSLTKNSGDLLIAIVAAYQSSATANTVWSAWGGSFTEFGDFSTTTTVAIGCAYKWSTGSETGTFTVTEAATVTGGASMCLMSIPGAHASTPPEAGSYATSAAGTANPASFDPAGWASEDTLWIAVAASGETSATGSWTGVTSAPTNYGSYADAATVDTSTIGEIEIAVAFRQLNASSEDVGAFTMDTSNARDAAITIAVRPAPDPPILAAFANTKVIDAQSVAMGAFF